MPPDICLDPIHLFVLPLNQSELGQELARTCLTTRDMFMCTTPSTDVQHQVLVCNTKSVFDAPREIKAYNDTKQKGMQKNPMKTSPN